MNIPFPHHSLSILASGRSTWFNSYFQDGKNQIEERLEIKFEFGVVAYQIRRDKQILLVLETMTWNVCALKCGIMYGQNTL
jgi:hypothetical protein